MDLTAVRSVIILTLKENEPSSAKRTSFVFFNLNKFVFFNVNKLQNYFDSILCSAVKKSHMILITLLSTKHPT